MTSPALPGPALWLAGPTASGKSAVALELALRLDAEIVSVDSMQVYRGLDIGTAKPGPEDRQRVPHHLLDVAGLDEAFNAARFVDHALAAARDIHQRGRIALFCGGTGLYFRALREGLDDAPAADPAVRAEIEATPPADLLRELESGDPVTFRRLDRANLRRVIRAVEVLRVTGRPPSAQRVSWQRPGASAAQAAGPLWVLERTPEDLRARVEARVDGMFAAGLVEETRALLRLGLAANRTALQALGYRQVASHLAGELDLPATLALVKRRTWQFARRQRTWFRREPGAVPVAVPREEAPEVTATRLLALP